MVDFLGSIQESVSECRLTAMGVAETMLSLEDLIFKQNSYRLKKALERANEV